LGTIQVSTQLRLPIKRDPLAAPMIITEEITHPSLNQLLLNNQPPTFKRKSLVEKSSVSRESS
jgi:hypothetical protein